MAKNYEGIKEVMQLTSENITRCEPCNYLPNDFADAMNHYLSSTHGYTLLHVGTQSSLSDKGDVFHDTTAVLGKAGGKSFFEDRDLG
ncbi:MAG: hypothetical protein ABSF52_23160 [Syntrophobacteraceae bacterium]|jgi:hypothetical protein